MGLREKVALAMLVYISTQIVCNHCMLRSDSNCPLKSCTNNAKSPELFRFPNVEYPSDYEAEEYYRFLSDYHQPNICPNNSSPQSQTHEREPIFKRKYDVATNIKAKPEITNSFTECDPIFHPYCFRKSSFFPEVEYPLSARDTWIPTYWSRLQDARRNSNLQKDITSTTTQFSNYDTGYNNSPLSSLIKALNTKKKSSSTTPISDTDYLPIPNEVDTIAVKNAFDTGGVISSTINPDLSVPGKDTTISTKNTAYSDVNPESVIPTKNMFCDILTSTANTKNNGSNLYIPGEGNINDFVSTAKTATYSDISLEPPVSNEKPHDQVVATPIENNNSDSYSPGECIQNNTVPTITQASNSDISFGPSVINKDLLDYIVPTSSGESSVTMNDPLGAIVPSKNKTKNNNIIPEVPQLTEGTALGDNIVPTTRRATDSVIQPATSMSKNDLLGDIMTSTINTKNGDIPLIKEDKRLCGLSNASTIKKAKSDIKPETRISKNDSLGDIVTTLSTTYAKTNEVIPKLPIPNIPIDNKDLMDNNVSRTINPTNRPTNPGTFISQNEPLDDIVTLTKNSKTSDIIPELPTVSTITTPMNNNATPEILITKNDPRDTCLESNSTMTTIALPILKTQITNNFSDFTPTQNLPKEDKSSDGIFTSTTTKATQTTVDIHSGQFSTKETPMSSSDMTSVASSNTNSIGTTASPFEFINPNNDIQANYFKAGNAQSNTGTSKLTNDWIMNQNIWQTVPEYSNDWIAYVENESALPTREKFCDEIFIVGGTKKCENSASPSTNTGKDNSGYIMLPTVPDYLDDSWLLLYDTGNTTQDLAPVYFSVESNTNEGSIPGANDTMSLIVFMDDNNSTLKYEYVDDASVLCTEMPYDLVVYPEYVNDIWSASANDSYVLYQPIYDYSDDICLLFIDNNGTIPSGDII